MVYQDYRKEIKEERAKDKEKQEELEMQNPPKSEIPLKIQSLRLQLFLKVYIDL